MCGRWLRVAVVMCARYGSASREATGRWARSSSSLGRSGGLALRDLVYLTGSGRGAVDELPAGTVTFLFTDLERSTPLWEQHPDAMRAALKRHDDILRNAVASHGGAVVKTTGDRLHAVFALASDRVGAAVAARDPLSGER